MLNAYPQRDTIGDITRVHGGHFSSFFAFA